MEIFDDERCDEVNDDIKLIQKIDGLTFGTDALLLAAYVGDKYNTALELGGGTGIVSMLVASRKKSAHVDCVELQSDFASLIDRNIELNRLSDSVRGICADAREYRPEREVELVFSNPPYMKSDSGRQNISSRKNIARHEICGDIGDFTAAAARCVKYGGDCVFVYRPDRMCDLIYEMRKSGIEPKRITFVLADEKSTPSMLLAEGKRGGKCGLKMTRPLIIYKSSAHLEYGEDMEYIMNTGSFPKEFYI